MQDEKDDGDDDQEMNQTAGDMKDKKSAQPSNKQNDGKNQKH
jgi:hypothetical protein